MQSATKAEETPVRSGVVGGNVDGVHTAVGVDSGEPRMDTLVFFSGEPFFKLYLGGLPSFHQDVPRKVAYLSLQTVPHCCGLCLCRPCHIAGRAIAGSAIAHCRLCHIAGCAIAPCPSTVLNLSLHCRLCCCMLYHCRPCHCRLCHLAGCAIACCAIASCAILQAVVGFAAVDPMKANNVASRQLGHGKRSIASDALHSDPLNQGRFPD